MLSAALTVVLAGLVLYAVFGGARSTRGGVDG
jgi:hypothetical protein